MIRAAGRGHEDFVRTSILVAATLLAACNGPRRYVGVADDDTSGGTGGGETGEGDPYATEKIQQTVNKNVDILIVMDNSSSMGEEQGKLALNLEPFINTLEEPGVEANYRIAFTTTDVGGHAACTGTTPEDGRFVLSSCRGRPADFVSDDPPQDLLGFACEDHCKLEPEDLDALMKPSPIDQAPGLALRPWLENNEGATNLPEWIAAQEAMPCFAPQGISGCEFESPLEAMRMALARTQNPDDPAYGFIRPLSHLFVLIITDEVDCSTQDEAIFDPDGVRVFWSDPDAAQATSAACWNAGTECTGGPGSYDECHGVDLDGNGVPADPADAVLFPLSRYTNVLQQIEDEKKKIDSDTEVVVSVITGVPGGYHQGQDDIIYADSPDSDFMREYGIGPGCSDGSGPQFALPPVRLREWAENFGDRNLYSICDEDYTPAFEHITDRIASQIKPACFETCVADVDPQTAGLQVDCTVLERRLIEGMRGVVPCMRNGDAYEVPDPEELCYYTLTDRTQKGDALDDMSDECIDKGRNLEFKILRREGFPAAPGSSIEATCLVSEQPAADCPW